MKGDQQMAQQCLLMSLKIQKSEEVPVAEQLNHREAEQRAELAEELPSFPLRDDPSRCIQIGSLLSEEEQGRLLTFLHHNVDIFAWAASDMTGIPSEVIVYKLNIDPNFKPIRQKKRSFAPERQKAIDEEVAKLLTAGFIREAHYPSWLANVVMIKKSNGK